MKKSNGRIKNWQQPAVWVKTFHNNTLVNSSSNSYSPENTPPKIATFVGMKTKPGYSGHTDMKWGR